MIRNRILNIKNYYDKFGLLLKKDIEFLKTSLNNKNEENLIEIIKFIYNSKIHKLYKNIKKFLLHKNYEIKDKVIECLMCPTNEGSYFKYILELYNDLDYDLKLRVLFNLGYSLNSIADLKLLKKITHIIYSNLNNDKDIQMKRVSYNALASCLELDIDEYSDYLYNFKLVNLDKYILKFKFIYINFSEEVPKETNLSISYKSTYKTMNTFFETSSLLDKNRRYLSENLEVSKGELRFNAFIKERIEYTSSIYEIDEISEMYEKKICEKKDLKIQLLYYLLYGSCYEIHKAIEIVGKNNLYSMSNVVAQNYLSSYSNQDYGNIEDTKMDIIACLICYLELPEYIDFVIDVIDNEETDELKRIALFSVGFIINKLDMKTQKLIANRLIIALDSGKYILESYFSILISIEKSKDQIFKLDRWKDKEWINVEEVNENFIKEFKMKYLNL